MRFLCVWERATVACHSVRAQLWKSRAHSKQHFSANTWARSVLRTIGVKQYAAWLCSINSPVALRSVRWIPPFTSHCAQKVMKCFIKQCILFLSSLQIQRLFGVILKEKEKKKNRHKTLDFTENIWNLKTSSVTCSKQTFLYCDAALDVVFWG